jgi:hypothetical protein
MLKNSLDTLFEVHTGTEADHNALGMLEHALDYLKGKDLYKPWRGHNLRITYAGYFFPEEPTDVPPTTT